MTWVVYVVLVVLVVAAVPAVWWLKRAGEREWERHRTLELARPVREALDRFVTVTITADVTRFVAAMEAAATAVYELGERLRRPTRRERLLAAVRRLLGGVL